MIKTRLSQIAALMVMFGGAAIATPDITGPWQVSPNQGALRTVTGEAPPLLPAAAAKYNALKIALQHDPKQDPAKRCLPPGVPRLMLQDYPFNVVQGRRTIAFSFEWNHLTRVIYMDRDHFETIGPLYLGQSIGHWDHNVLVIDTNSFNDTTWLDNTGLPHSDQLHVVEHIRLIHGGNGLEDRLTIEDPATYSKIWDTTIQFQKRPGVLILEDYCLGRN